MKKVIAATVALAIVGWLAWPYLAASTIARAINEGDTVKLERQFDWPSVRQGFKDDLNTVFARSAKNELANNPFGGLAAAVVPAMINQFVDAYMTPSYLATLMREHNPGLAKVQSSESPSDQQVTSLVESATHKIRIENVGLCLLFRSHIISHRAREPRRARYRAHKRDDAIRGFWLEGHEGLPAGREDNRGS
jgi:hypothetical protein